MPDRCRPGAGVIQLLLDQFDAATLRELASLKERVDPERIARRQLTDDGVEKLSEILVRGDRPTIGFWTRYRAMPAASPDEAVVR